MCYHDEIDNLKTKLKCLFSAKDIGCIKPFMTIDFEWNSDCLEFSQKKMIEKACD